MKHFAFRMQHLLNLREQEEELVKLRLGQASRRVEELDLAIADTHTREREALGQYRNPADMQVAQMFMIRMQQERKRLAKRREEAEQQRLVIVEEYKLARQKAEVLRKLRGKQYDVWRMDWLEQQDAQSDDLGAARRILQMKSAPVYSTGTGG